MNRTTGGGIPTVSVVIPTFKRAATISGAIRSVLEQTFGDIEVLVVDDYSQDGTADVVAGIPDPRVRLLQHEVNKGGNAARATGIDSARGTWVAFLDSDDEWLPDKLEKQLKLMAHLGQQYGLCTTWFRFVNPAGDVVGTNEPRMEGVDPAVIQCRNVLGSFSGALIKRDALLAAGSVDVSLPACQDWDLFARVSKLVKVAVVEEHLVRYLVDLDDPVRITGSQQKVMQGLRHMYANYRAQSGVLSPQLRRTALRYFGESFAHVGSFGDVFRVVRDGISVAPVKDAPFALHMLLRSARRVVREAAADQRAATERYSKRGRVRVDSSQVPDSASQGDSYRAG